MVAGRQSTELEKEHRRPVRLSSGTSASVSSSLPASVSAISSTAFFDSPHFSRRQPFKSMPVPVSSEAPPSEPSEGTPRGYRPPPPSYGSHYPYAYHPGGHHYGPPPHGYSPHHGGAPGYPHHHAHPGAYSPPPPGYPGRSMYGYGGGYDERGTSPGYPAQQSRDSHQKPSSYPRGRSSGDSVSGNRSTASGSQRASSVSGARKDGVAKPSPDQTATVATEQEPLTQAAEAEPAQPAKSRSSPTKLADENETERLRQAALTEISASQVEPIKTAFHFFVKDMREVIRPLAEEEVRKSISAPAGELLDPYLVNSNMNCRLMKAWEDLNEESRQACMRKEEEDRRRFMEEEEIASRHCATLTARSKSPKTPERRNSSQNTSSEYPNRASLNPSPTSLATTNPEPSPSPISRLSVTRSASMDNDEKKMDDSALTVSHSSVAPSPVKSVAPKRMGDVGEGRILPLLDEQDSKSDVEGGTKRPSPSKQDDNGRSPPKRNRLEEDGLREASPETSSPSS